MSKLRKTDRNRRIVVYGAGGIGGVLGACLAKTGTDVVLIGRSGHVNVIREHGLRFVTPSGTSVLKVSAVTAPDQVTFKPGDLVFLCVKSQDTDKALHDLHAVVKDIPVFCLQNGVRSEEIASKYFRNVYGVVTRVATVFTTDGEVTCRRDPPGGFLMGRYPVGTDALLKSVAVMLSDAGFHVEIVSDVMSYKWGKLLINLANSIEAIINQRGGENYRIARTAVQEEATKILTQAGIRCVPEEEMQRMFPEVAQPTSSLKTEALGSTWQSLARRKGTVETEFLNGEIVRVAKRLGLRAPINEQLLRMTEEMAANRELPGKYISAQLLQMLGLAKNSTER